MVHSKPKEDGVGTKPINEEAARIFLELEELEQRELSNGRELTTNLMNQLYFEKFGSETRNAVRGYGIGVQWDDVPGVRTIRKRVSTEVTSLRSDLEASYAQIAKLTEDIAERDEKIKVVESKVSGFEAHINNPLLSGEGEGINNLMAKLVQIAAQKEFQSIPKLLHSLPWKGT